MNKPAAQTTPRLWKGLVIVEVLIGLGIILVPLGGTALALRLEESDPFCAGCHTQPEMTYVQQSLAAQPATLAAAHHDVKDTVRCIDCHSGAGGMGRITGLTQGAQDLAAYLGGHYHSPAVTLNRLPDSTCTKCHSDIVPLQVVTRVRGTRNHYHLYLPYWRQVDSRAAQCTDCHTAHTIGNSVDHFVNNGQAGIVCENCHKALSGKTTQ